MPLLVFSTSRQGYDEAMLDDINHDLIESNKFNYEHRPLYRALLLNDHQLWKKSADFEQILKPCNQIPASGRGHEYADCVRSRMLLMGKRK